jgi:hypothetical protein
VGVACLVAGRRAGGAEIGISISLLVSAPVLSTFQPASRVMRPRRLRAVLLTRPPEGRITAPPTWTPRRREA